MKTLIARAGLVLALVSPVACSPSDLDGSSSGSQLFELTTSNVQPITGLTDWSSLASYAQTNGYYDARQPSATLQGGEKVYFSASYNDGEAGQAHGSIARTAGRGGKDRFTYVQEGNPTTQAMLPPGLGQFTGQSLWNMGRFVETMASVALGRGVGGPDYPNVKAETVSLEGGTAGGHVAYTQALKVTLSGSWSGGQSEAIIIFVKGLGPRIMEFRETNMPSGTTKVYIANR